jgi:hypothetical protein
LLIKALQQDRSLAKLLKRAIEKQGGNPAKVFACLYKAAGVSPSIQPPGAPIVMGPAVVAPFPRPEPLHLANPPRPEVVEHDLMSTDDMVRSLRNIADQIDLQNEPWNE